MSGYLTNLATSGEKKVNTLRELEPHVDIFNIESADKKKASLPVEILTYTIFGLLFMGIFITFSGKPVIYSQIILLLAGFIAPFYLPYIFCFMRYLKKDKQTEIEVDRKHGLIKYFNPDSNKNLLFHQSQVEKCIIHQSLFMPLNLDYIVLYLKGGETICFSSLVIAPTDFVRRSTLPYSTRGKLFNLIPAS